MASMSVCLLWRNKGWPIISCAERGSERRATIDAELQELWQRIYRVEARQDQDWHKQERDSREQREVLRALEDLTCKEREMYELDNRKDQVMTVCKVALVNLVMWTRDHYFPLTYAHATWKRLASFFRLPGRVTRGPRAVSVELRPFNDRHLNHDLVALCERVNQAAPQLPDGRRLLFSVCPLSDRQRCRQDCALASVSGELDRDSQRCYTPADICMVASCTSVEHRAVPPGSFGGGEHGARYVRDGANLL